MSGRTMPDLNEEIDPELKAELEEREEKEDRKRIVSWRRLASTIQNSPEDMEYEASRDQEDLKNY